jgi:predicted MFS family arabinose efflux permease
MYFGAGIAVLGGILAMIFLIEPLKQAPVSEPVNLKFYDKRIMPYLIGWALVFLVFTSTQVIAAFFIEDQLGVSTQSEIIKATSISLLSMALTTTLMQAVVLQIINVSPRTLLRLCFFIFGAVLFVIPMAKSLGYFYLSFAGIGIAFSMVTPGLNSAATLSVETHEQGEVAGLLAAAPVVGMIFGPTIGALLYTADPSYPFLFGSLIAIALGIYFQFLKIPKTEH